MIEYVNAPDRLALWSRFLRDRQVRTMAEIGVHRGRFAAAMLADVPGLAEYVMVDPWRNIPDWNKPLNQDNHTLEAAYRECLATTEFAAAKRRVLRGKTTEVVGGLADGSLDFAYIDGDHTLKGITIDLLALYPKVREGGWIAGDDFCPSIWQHSPRYEPTLVFPLAVHFAEALGLTIHALPHHQFLIHKQQGQFRFIDLVGTYGDASLKGQLAGPLAPAAVSPRETVTG